MVRTLKAMVSYAGQSSLRKNLLTVVVAKILFLTVFWEVVLSPQAHHVDADAMQQKFISKSTIPLE